MQQIQRFVLEAAIQPEGRCGFLKEIALPVRAERE